MEIALGSSEVIGFSGIEGFGGGRGGFLGKKRVRVVEVKERFIGPFDSEFNIVEKGCLRGLFEYQVEHADNESCMNGLRIWVRSEIKALIGIGNRRELLLKAIGNSLEIGMSGEYEGKVRVMGLYMGRLLMRLLMEHEKGGIGALEKVVERVFGGELNGRIGVYGAIMVVDEFEKMSEEMKGKLWGKVCEREDWVMEMIRYADVMDRDMDEGFDEVVEEGLNFRKENWVIFLGRLIDGVKKEEDIERVRLVAEYVRGAIGRVSEWDEGIMGKVVGLLKEFMGNEDGEVYETGVMGFEKFLEKGGELVEKYEMMEEVRGLFDKRNRNNVKVTEALALSAIRVLGHGIRMRGLGEDLRKELAKGIVSGIMHERESVFNQAAVEVDSTLCVLCVKEMEKEREVLRALAEGVLARVTEDKEKREVDILRFSVTLMVNYGLLTESEMRDCGVYLS